MNKPNFKLTLIQLIVICTAAMLYVSFSDGVALCMPAPEVPGNNPDKTVIILSLIFFIASSLIAIYVAETEIPMTQELSHSDVKPKQ